MTDIPLEAQEGDFFYHQDAPGDIGIYAVQSYGDGTLYHTYQASLPCVRDAEIAVADLNMGKITIDQLTEKIYFSEFDWLCMSPGGDGPFGN